MSAHLGKVKATMDRHDQAEQYLVHRVRYLPVALEAARRKVAALENEARRYGMVDLVEQAQ